MKILIEIFGIVLVLAGLVFTAQSESYVGPQSSFMYSNPSLDNKWSDDHPGRNYRLNSGYYH